MKRPSKLAIVDWGIGGISIYKLVKERLGDVGVVYFSDTGAMPYGKMSRRELTSRLNAVIEFLAANGATHLVIGCNAASTAIPFLNSNGLKIEGVIETAVEVAAKAKPKRLGLIGGRRTVLSGVYRNAFAERRIKVDQRIAQPLSALIESGDVSSDKLRGECRRILSPLKNCSHILLACTHYPAISDVLDDFVGPTTAFVDPAASLVNKIKRWKLPAGGKDEFLTSGDPTKMKKAANAAFGVDIPQIHTSGPPL
jgi:glutamate racemase